MSRQNGALRIFLYNWPVYVGTWAAALLLLLAVLYTAQPLSLLLALAAGGAFVWSVVSLLVSTYIYDRSALVAGAWMPRLLGPRVQTWSTVHAGLDAEVELDAVLPGQCLARLDIFDSVFMTSSSITRARRRTGSASAAIACSATALALADASCDAIVVAFTAHEIRSRPASEAFFGELHRALRPGGRAVIVEHLRDWPNFFAFGPGFLHFVARREWLRLAAHATFRVASETRVTPWVMALSLEKSE